MDRDSPDGTTRAWSKLPNEQSWVVDALFRRNQPVFVNGFGQRCGGLRVATAEVAAILDAVADAVGLALGACEDQ